MNVDEKVPLSKVLDDIVKTVMIDKDSISQLNNILGGLKVCDMDGKKLRLKIELCEED